MGAPDTRAALHEGALPSIGKGLESTVLSSATVSGRPALLYLNTRIVEIAKLPVEQQLQRLNEAGHFKKQRITDYPLMSRLYFVPRIEKITTTLANGEARTQAQLRCALAAVASERYRRTHDDPYRRQPPKP